MTNHSSKNCWLLVIGYWLLVPTSYYHCAGAPAPKPQSPEGIPQRSGGCKGTNHLVTTPNFQALASHAPTSLPGPAITFADFKRALLNHWQIFGLTVFAIVALITVYVFQLPNIYTSICTIRADRDGNTEVRLDKSVRDPKTTDLTTTEFTKTQESLS